MNNSVLATSVALPCGTTLPNRIARSAMTEALADRYDNPTEALCRLYRRWSNGGYSLQLTGNVMVDRRFLERPGNVVVEDERAFDSLRSWVDAAKSGGSQVWMQISHPGRQCPMVVNAHPLSPSEEKLRILGFYGRPRAMTPDDIEEAINRYAKTAVIARKAGFDGVQIHGAHGYLISQFLSPLTNRRTDEWGGSLENRARFLRRVYAAMREAVGPDYPVAVKLNSADFQKGGFSLGDCARVARWLEADGIDLIELSGGTYEQMSMFRGPVEDQRESTRRREAYFMEYAREVRAAVRIPIMVTGGFRSSEAMERAISEDGIDMVGIARPTCVQPDAASRLLKGDVARIGIDEAGLAMGKGRLGLNTNNWLVNLVNTVSRVEYHCWQMTRMSRGEEPQTHGRANALGYFLWYLGRTTFLAIRRRIP
ncbi:NADH:flavin oxidoreductase/NADH oxidase family protein [Marimonas arenosa]|uniref:NADH:flavin oxidoreductase/NADH oxidase family protein n=1 Tax=Marimonas arenosa TaxID=1795305 RepID=A0AAE3W9I5_9RHOB|nr:NADH:flavin oxidoreductase/NADH oxidase family protein [Marimonas arenosa]MDQ2088704.1 NADH:flavin oxidoreductase/NADH oxidase family protein [Marimonas arenosa]